MSEVSGSRQLEQSEFWTKHFYRIARLIRRGGNVLEPGLASMDPRPIPFRLC